MLFMPDGWKWHRARLCARLPKRDTTASARRASTRECELLAAAWEALNVGRDNKALVIAKADTLLDANQLALHLCGHALADIVGKSITPELLENVPSPRGDFPKQRWETLLSRACGNPIAVEVVREPLGTRLHGVDVYAIRDLRERHDAAEERHRQITALRQREEEFERQNLRFEMALKSLSQGICVFDADQRLVICNEPYLSIYGLPPDEVKPGISLREILEKRVAKGMHAGTSPEAFINERLAIVAEKKAAVVMHHLPDGRIVELTHDPIPGGGWVATHEDVTERRRMEAALSRSNRELEEQNRRFDTAMNNISQGLCFFDGNQRLIVCNQRYVQMYRLPEDSVRPGITLREIVEHRFKAGSCPEMTATQYLAWRDNIAVSNKASDSTVKLTDGRTFAIHHEPMPDGGWVATHQDITEQCVAEARIAHMAQHDALTGLPNRVLFNGRLEQALTHTGREIVAAHLFDLDNFKTVNDTLGHPAGDKLLQMVADRVSSVVRETDTIARMGGDEFAIVQVALSDPIDATLLAHRVIARVSEPYEIEGHQVMIGASVGIAIGRQGDNATAEQLVRNADLALYRAKGDGRGTFCIFEPEMDAQMQGRRELEQDMRKALAAGEFELYYQPLVDIASNQITGFEALMRWRHPEKGVIEPSAFIPLAEEIGLIIPMGEWAIRDACATVARWPAHLKVAVNLSPVQFRSPGLLRTITGALAASTLAPDRLELEITESALLHDIEAALAALYEIRDLGVRIAMDDFGTGYSSLSHLQSFPFDRIKIDRSFVNDIVESASSLNIVRAVTSLARSLGMGATAEGVETAEQRATLQSEGCTEMQGFLFSQPLPAREIERLFLARPEVQLARQDQTAA
jgi:diguanylate cyclase (GGDEF)-like protein